MPEGNKKRDGNEVVIIENKIHTHTEKKSGMLMREVVLVLEILHLRCQCALCMELSVVQGGYSGGHVDRRPGGVAVMVKKESTEMEK